MKATFPTNHNFYEENPISGNENLRNKFEGATYSYDQKLFPLQSEAVNLTTKSVNIKQLPIFRFTPEKDITKEKEEQLILKLYQKEIDGETQYIVQTGLFAGVVYYKGCEFNIECAYGEAFLSRMLNVLNGIYIDTNSVTAEKNDTSNVFLHIMAHLFIQSLERSSALGLPKVYQTQIQRSHKVRGSVDINAYLRQDIPFQGKLTTRFREQCYVPEIIDVLFVACEKLKKVFDSSILQPILNIYQQLKIEHSGRFVNQMVIDKAKQSKTLHNPMFSEFKKVLEYAEIIINNVDLKKSAKANNETHGYLFDISQLFEVYLEKLLQRRFPDWSVNEQEKLRLYASQFYSRHIYPDIVMKHRETGKVIVFDAKFKQMKLNDNNKKHKDLDRNDFYQIHTYMQYYGKNLLFGGLLYPLSQPLNKDTAHSQSLFGLDDSRPPFIVDGIYVKQKDNVDKNIDSLNEIIDNENEFIERIEKLSDSLLNQHQ